MTQRSEAREIMIITAQITVEIPQPPNFLRLVKNPDADDTDAATIDVADVTEDALRKVAASWTEALVANAASRRVGCLLAHQK